LRTWNIINDLNPDLQKVSLRHSTPPEKESELASLLEEEIGLSRKNEQYDVSDESMRQKIMNVLNSPKQPLNANILQYWDLKKLYEPELYKISQVILAVPPTQVSVERAFSALALILTYLRTKMRSDNLENILITNLNKEYVDSMEFD
jgi:hAT family C-terminal dimerisation region